MRAIYINAIEQSIIEIELPEENQLAALQELVGGYIEVAHHFPNGDVLFMDEDGLLKKPRCFFIVDGARQPFAGSGVIVGHPDPEGNETPADIAVNTVRRLVRFIRRQP